MESSRVCVVTCCSAFLLLLLGASCQETGELEPRSLDFYTTVESTSREKELLEALQEVLEKLKSKRIPSYEKKYGQVPMCEAGDQCAVRKGPRIGKLCDCPRRTSCNTYLLKCL
ncbi:cocaine- and amphetamine-regulated transcript protein [Microcaecilia unicolor]|uniref:Cocaine- and amphetamine-regulated transcript protein n=1 Tax=Microcaecilia unicolor TaxID=1415580 RepID=A0A6P7XDB0_9AMPH|nr:cocaine- and amphetamine-regulated transcript protein [Microcaecilia unicolor]